MFFFFFECKCYIFTVLKIYPGSLAHWPGGVIANGPGRVIPKTQKMVLDISLSNTQHYKVWGKGKVEQSRERSGAFYYTSV